MTVGLNCEYIKEQKKKVRIRQTFSLKFLYILAHLHYNRLLQSCVNDKLRDNYRQHRLNMI